MHQLLFIGQSVSNYFEQQRLQMQAAVNEMTSEELSDPEAALTEVMSARDTAVPRLVREKAQFSTDDAGGRVQVAMTVPFEGSRTYFSIAPARRQLNLDTMTPEKAQRPQSQSADFVSSLESRGTDQAHQFTMHETFPGGTDAAEIRAWAKQQVDAVEAKLDDLVPTSLRRRRDSASKPVKRSQSGSRTWRHSGASATNSAKASDTFRP